MFKTKHLFNLKSIFVICSLPIGAVPACSSNSGTAKTSVHTEVQGAEGNPKAPSTSQPKEDRKAIEIERNASVSLPPEASPNWDKAVKQKTPEEIAAAEKKSKETLDAGIAAGDTQGTELKYPKLFYRGTGTYSCQGEVNPSTARVISQLFIDNLDSQLDDAKAQHPRQAVQNRINGDLQNSLDSSVYKRLTTEEREDWKKKGYDLADHFAIFALAARKPKAGQVFIFDQPLPIAFWPASLSRYDDLISKGPRVWTSKVTGTRSFTANVTLSHVSTEGDKIVMKLQTLIPEDRDRSIYEVFPIPKEAIYTIDTALKHVESSKNTNWFFGDNCDGNPEQIVMNYRLCRKEIGGRYEDFPCQ